MQTLLTYHVPDPWPMHSCYQWNVSNFLSSMHILVNRSDMMKVDEHVSCGLFIFNPANMVRL